MRPGAWLLCAMLGVTAALAARAHEAHHQNHDAAKAGVVKVSLSEGPLLDQSGRLVRLAKDVIAERVAVVNFVYTACTTVCPVSSATFSRLQVELGAALGKEVVMVSITVDPLRDTPQRLREYAARYGAREGWVWLTGAKREVDEALKGLGAYTPNFEDHPAMVLVGDAAGGWTRLFGFPSVEQLLERVAAARKDRS